ncbi:Gfo/Idh/MocA family oxidoreductase [Mariprofundus ferrooxydans]|uniref:Gfo/Idh/MocA family oxidoreductase n=1 Tax=Mariprofundus ferrooxydans TaxID=314344 RepID=UPI00039DDA13|nr:Gfo/Idh/MocA family oxidoreductase [Mariprofundus ferrooxydans]
MKKYPDYIVVAGGGRWARVLTEVLCRLLPFSVTITVYSPHCADAMATWAEAKGLHGRVSTSSVWPVFPLGQSSAMVVANAARDHYRTAKKALESRMPVLVEKPLTLSFSDSQDLARIAQANHVYLAPAHVFLFAPYLDAFSRLVSSSGKISCVKVFWSDPKSEQRYGEGKYYDPALPVYADWMPHVLSALSTVVSIDLCECEHVHFFKGGAQIKLMLRLGDVQCEVNLIRNGESRRRIVDVVTDSGRSKLDFSTEPGVIYQDSCVVPEDTTSYWREDKGPVARMLDAFFQGVVCDELRDKRLDIGLGLRCSMMIDQIEGQYQQLQGEWLQVALGTFDQTDEHLQYGLGEILQLRGPVSSERLANMLARIRSAFTGKKHSLWLNKLAASNDHAHFLRELARESPCDI